MKHWSRKLKGSSLQQEKLWPLRMHTIWGCIISLISNLPSHSPNQAWLRHTTCRCKSSIISSQICQPTTSLSLQEELFQMASQICCSRTLLAASRGLTSVAEAHILWSLKAHPFLPVKAAVLSSSFVADLHTRSSFAWCVGLFIDGRTSYQQAEGFIHLRLFFIGWGGFVLFVGWSGLALFSRVLCPIQI